MNGPKRSIVSLMAVAAIALGTGQYVGCGRIINALEALSGGAQEAQQADQARRDASGAGTRPVVVVPNPLIGTTGDSPAWLKTTANLVDGLVAILALTLGGGSIYIVRKDRKKNNAAGP